MQRGHETEHRSAVGVPTDRLSEAPGGCPATAWPALTMPQLCAESPLDNRHYKIRACIVTASLRQMSCGLM